MCSVLQTSFQADQISFQVLSSQDLNSASLIRSGTLSPMESSSPLQQHLDPQPLPFQQQHALPQQLLYLQQPQQQQQQHQLLQLQSGQQQRRKGPQQQQYLALQ